MVGTLMRTEPAPRSIPKFEARDRSADRMPDVTAFTSACGFDLHRSEKRSRSFFGSISCFPIFTLFLLHPL